MSAEPSLDASSPAAVEALAAALARCGGFLAPDAWDGVVDLMRAHAPIGRAAITLRDGPSHYRIFALSRGPGYDFAPFQQRLPILPHTDEIVYRRGEPYLCDDTRAGSVIEQMIAYAGYLSYTLVPMRDARGVFGDVLFAFEEVGAVRHAPMPLLLAFAQTIAAAIPAALEALRAQRLARILEASTEALVAWDVEGVITEANPAAERLLGRPRPELLGRTFEEVLGRSPAEGERGSGFRWTVSRADGSQIVLSAVVARSVGDPLVAGHALLRDASELVAAEEHLVHTDRLATIGMLAAGVAHEINNPAAFLLLGLDLVGRRLRGLGDASAARSEIEGLLVELREATQRIVTITRDLRHFATPGGGAPVLVDVGRAIDSALSLVRAQILERADLEVDVEPDLPAVLLEEGRLSQVLVNLLVNAVQATPKGLGRAVVRVEARRAGAMLTIAVSDTGVGLPPEVLEQMWTPFFTTKPQGQGSGLGLSISRGIVESAGGTLRASSGSRLREGCEGARFVVELPVAREPSPPGGVSSAPPPASSPVRRSVLLVEDEPGLARALVEQLGAVHDVTLVARGDDAVLLLVSRRFDVVLCDLRMPGLSGEAVYQRVAARDPAQAGRFVFMTGVGFGEDTERFLRASGVPVLEKPFSIEDALRVVARIGTAPRADAAR